MKNSITRYRFLIACCCALLCVGVASCVKDGLSGNLTPEQVQLIGRGVNFNATVADEYDTKASYADPGGSLNVGDQITIYRQYWTGSDFGEEEYRQYRLFQRYATGTEISVGNPQWLPIDNRIGGFWNGTETVRKTQYEADSLIWDNDRTVRFRAIGRSNYAGGIGGKKETFYPDFTISDWVTVSGPTVEIPFTMKHLGSRIYFYPRSAGNYIQKVEICTEAADYAWSDNSTTTDKDNLDKLPVDGTGLTASEAAKKVLAVYNRMCMPAGVDKETGLLKAMPKSFYDSNSDFSTIMDNVDDMVAFGAKTAAEIVSDVVRPSFTSRLYGNRLFFVAIPYDMSSESTQGEALVLPSYTRFRVYMYDVNNGDTGSNRDEGTYHIFSLSDVMRGDESAFPNGLEFQPGMSYNFQVGYVYDKLAVEVSTQVSWAEENLKEQKGQQENSEPTPSDEPYKWWRDAIDEAIESATTSSGSYNPVFHIKNEKEFLEFINLVNGTAAANTSGLEQAWRRVEDTSGNVLSRGYWWYTGLNAQGDTLWTTADAMKDQGYVFYNRYYQSVGDIRAESRPAYLKGPFSFYDSSFNLHFSVILDKDLDMDDWELETIGKTAASSFRGAFDGNNHSISNLYVKDEYLFGNVEGADIRNLILSSSEKLSLVNEAKGSNYIAGISLKADCTASSIANSIIGVDELGRQNASYVVACFHEGKAGAAMVGTADNLYMYGCMETGEGIPAGGALLGQYYDSNQKFFAPQKGIPEWGRFMCNYYNKELSPGTRATSESETAAKDQYKAQEYIRGAKSHVLKALKDYLLPDELPYDKLTIVQKEEIYGLAPWRAMNFAIVQYNASTVGQIHPCTLHYENNLTGYANRYPELKAGVPGNGQYANVLDQNN